MSQNFSTSSRQVRVPNDTTMRHSGVNEGAMFAHHMAERPAPLVHASPPARPPPSDSPDNLDSELWHACAGPLTSLPPVNSIVMYWPQGHIEQVAACTTQSVVDELPKYSLPPHIVCRLVENTLSADPDSDEVFAQMTLNPVPEGDVASWSEEPPAVPKRNLHMFCKTLTASDTSTHGGFSVPRRAAEDCLPQLDYTMNPPCQELVAKDLHGVEWKFRHIYRGHPRRHLLTTGWSVFVSTKKLVAGDSVLFLRGENGHLRLGVRRAAKQQQNRSSYFSSQSMHLGVLAAASHAAREKLRFSVIYNPRTSPSEFVIPYHKCVKAINNPLTVGMRFKMRFETEDSSERRYAGTITSVGDVDAARWPKSSWRSLKVGWDESAASERHERVSPWEIEPFIAPTTMAPTPLGPRLKRRPSLLTEVSPLGARSAQDFQSNKLSRVLQGHVPLDLGMCGGDDEEAASSRPPSWLVKSEDGYKREGVSRSRGDGWTTSHRPENGHVSEMLLRQIHQERQEKPQLDDLATSLQLSPVPLASYMRPHPLGEAGLNLSYSSHIVTEPSSNKLQWQSLTGSSQQPSLQDSLPSWFTLANESASSSRPVVGMPERSLPINQTQMEKGLLGLQGHSLSVGVCPKQPELQQVCTPSPQVEQDCKIFGFTLTNKRTWPVSSPQTTQGEDSESSGHCPVAEIAKPSTYGSLGTGASLVMVEQEIIPQSTGPNTNLGGSTVGGQDRFSNGGAQSWIRPVRSYTKVYKQGKPGRSIDLSRYENYDELRRGLTTLFNLEGQLDDLEKGWQVVYTDHEDDVLLVGDDPWVEFCSCVRSLKILSPAEVAGHDVGKRGYGSSDDGRDSCRPLDVQESTSPSMPMDHICD